MPDLPQEGKITITGDKYYHLARSVRARPGDHFRLFNGKGLFAEATIDDIDSKKIRATIVSSEIIDNTPSVKLTLAFGLLSGDSLKIVLAGATQLGVVSIIPFTSAFNDIKIPPDKHETVLNRWQKIIIENSAIALRSHLTLIEKPVDLQTIITRSKDSENKFVFWEENGYHWNEYLPLDHGTAIAIIGPKGGLHPDEVVELQNAGFITLSMGETTLKAEFAAISACSRIIGK